MNNLNKDTFKRPSFSLENRVARLIWNWVYVILFKYSPRPLHSWRSFLLRLFGAKIGKGVHVYPKAIIWAPWNLEIGDESGIANDVVLYSQGRIIIGKRSVISQGSYICTGTHDYTKKEHPLFTVPIEIGDFVWIASKVFVHPGVNIGKGVVVGACSVVTKNLSEWGVYTGNPCIRVKKREFNDFDSDTH